MNELYEELETPECERKIYRIAKAKDFTKNNQIKEEHSVLLRGLGKILGRWKGYFDKLLNGENHRVDPDGVPNDGLTQRIGRNEVLKCNVITNEERRDNGNGWDSRRRGCVWEKKGLTCYQYDAKCIRAGEYINAGRTLQHKPLSTTEGQRVALMNMWGILLKSGAIRSILDTDGQKSGSYRRGLVPRRKTADAI